MERGKIVHHIQYLRALAVGLVVLHHAWQIVPHLGHKDLGNGFPTGASGVDLFFVISGFIMLAITQDREAAPIGFILRRFSRVAPMYWIMTTVMLLAAIIAPKLFMSAKPTLVQYITSLAFVPWPHPTLPEASPLLQVGWTLNYEFMFYILFALSMAFSHRYRAIICSFTLIGLVILGFFLGHRQVIFDFYTSPIILEFVFGMIIYKLTSPKIARSSIIFSAIALMGLGLLAATIAHPSSRIDPLRPMIWGVPSALLVLGAVGLETSRTAIKAPLPEAIGNASYAIYLTHLFTLGAERFVWAKFHLGRVTDLSLLATGLVASCFVGWVAHKWVEMPASEVVRRRLLRLAQSRREPALIKRASL